MSILIAVVLVSALGTYAYIDFLGGSNMKLYLVIRVALLVVINILTVVFMILFFDSKSKDIDAKEVIEVSKDASRECDNESAQGNPECLNLNKEINTHRLIPKEGIYQIRIFEEGGQVVNFNGREVESYNKEEDSVNNGSNTIREVKIPAEVKKLDNPFSDVLSRVKFDKDFKVIK